jgi:tellurite resistance protein TerC
MFIFWLGFVLLIILLLAFDLGIINRNAHVISTKEAIGWSFFWIGLSLAFNVLIYFLYHYHWHGIGFHTDQPISGQQAALQFFTGYIIEKSLSLDNIFVIALIFSYFKVPAQYQHRVLFWGILGAIILRGIMIIGGTVLVQKFQWMIYVFGVMLIITSIKMLVANDDQIEPDHNILVRLARKFFPVTSNYHAEHFFIIEKGKYAITPLFLVLLVIESSDVLFAVDSIPAIFAITQDPYIIFTSNIFAILGLRALYFALAIILKSFFYVKFSLVFILAYVGVKMLLSHFHPIPTYISLSIISVALFIGIAASIIRKKKENRTPIKITKVSKKR